MSVNLVLAELFLVAIFVVPTAALYVYLVSRPERTSTRSVDLLAAVVIVVTCVLLSLLAMTRLGAVGPIWSGLFVVAALAIAVAFAMGARRNMAEVDGPASEIAPGLVALGAIAVIAVPFWVIVLDRLDSFGRVTGWFYWKVVQDVAAANGFPASTVEWGITTNFFNFHVAFSALGAAVAEASGDPTSLASAQAVRLAAGLAMPAAAYLAIRAWGAGRLAGVVGALLVTAVWVTGTKPIAYVPEGLGHIFAVLLIGLIPAALMHRERLAQIALIGGMAAITQLHGVASTFTYLVVLGALIALVVSPATQTTFVNRLRIAFFIGLAALIAALAVGSVLGARSSAASILSDAASVRDDGSDPTWEFVVLATTRGELLDEDMEVSPPSNRELLGRGPTRGFLNTEQTISAFVVAGVVLLGAYGVARKQSRDESLFPLLTLLLAVALVVGGGILLALPYETYVPRRTGVQRVAQLWIILPALLAAVLAHRTRDRIFLTGALFGVALMLWAVAVPKALDSRDAQASREEIAELAALPIEPGSTVLTNSWTQGMLVGTTTGTGLMDGQAPYLNPELLARSLDMLEDVRTFLVRPKNNMEVLAVYDVDYVLVGHNRWSFGGAPTFAAAQNRLSRIDPLTPVWTTENYLLFAVDNEALR